jgi:hypothetical protein
MGRDALQEVIAGNTDPNPLRHLAATIPDPGIADENLCTPRGIPPMRMADARIELRLAHR